MFLGACTDLFILNDLFTLALISAGNIKVYFGLISGALRTRHLSDQRHIFNLEWLGQSEALVGNWRLLLYHTVSKERFELLHGNDDRRGIVGIGHVGRHSLVC